MHAIYYVRRNVRFIIKVEVVIWSHKKKKGKKNHDEVSRAAKPVRAAAVVRCQLNAIITPIICFIVITIIVTIIVVRADRGAGAAARAETVSRRAICTQQPQ